MKGLIPLLGLALLLPGTAEAEVVAPGVSQGALAVARFLLGLALRGLDVLEEVQRGEPELAIAGTSAPARQATPPPVVQQ